MTAMVGRTSSPPAISSANASLTMCPQGSKETIRSASAHCGQGPMGSAGAVSVRSRDVDRVEPPRRHRERPVERVGPGVGADDVPARAVAHAPEHRAARLRVRRPPLDGNRLGGPAGVGRQADMAPRPPLRRTRGPGCGGGSRGGRRGDGPLPCGSTGVLCVQSTLLGAAAPGEGARAGRRTSGSPPAPVPAPKRAGNGMKAPKVTDLARRAHPARPARHVRGGGFRQACLARVRPWGHGCPGNAWERRA